MPAYLRPGLRVPVWLRADKDLEPRPTFWARVLTMAEQVELGDAIDAMHENLDQTTRELFDKAQQLFRQHVDGWENLPEDFDLDKLSYAELRELLISIQGHQWLEPVEKKDLELRGSYVAGNFVSDAA